MKKLSIRARVEGIDKIYVGWWDELPDWIEINGGSFVTSTIHIYEVYE